MRILIQIRQTPDVTAAVIDEPYKQSVPAVVGDLPGVLMDESYSPVAMPRPLRKDAGGDPLSLRGPLTFSWEPEEASVLVRGEVADDELGPRLAVLAANRPDIVGVFADPVISTMPCCDGDPIGTWEDVADLLHVSELQKQGLEGTSVPVAVVDTGIKAAHLGSSGAVLPVDRNRSWSPAGVGQRPGEHEVGHGTMCAFDIGIVAPKAELLDIPVLLSNREGRTLMEGLTSDAIAAYSHLRRVFDMMPHSSRALVVNNSWGCYSPQWDFAPGQPGNYSDSLAHPFNVAVAALESAGADILFAAGNCGRDCPSPKCAYDRQPIGGANSHPQVLSIAGADVKGQRVGYSSQGPGRLDRRKPDVCSYTHFLGSQALGAGKPDNGTSAACPVAAGVVAALRTAWPSSQVSPEQMRQMIQRAASDPTGSGFSDDYGYGVINVRGILDSLQRRRPI
ncbi:S8 family peptidase [Streptomyces griseoruber]|uniref:S8 family peptidase n=1 Tax=Streptomyces griseoruber TaxID=1943 RepID=UPI00099E5E3E|nr:S8 family serine peptidase [Streptomyces griseoruber]